ncbi:helix-turn-helix domain-containing protein [Marinobacter alexandrii]|uniref:helix-turn-helix domain-containing protein n=1 Tax=Marinobacter alexandrii TaxID=2570351 RepID=UPI001108C0DB|nr:helix-turn-helix domain-containing protein [Marinobacter alexandrii]
MNVLKKAIDQIPGKVPAAAKACGVSVRAVYKWVDRGMLPRTEYTGETDYASKLAEESGGAFEADWLKSEIIRDNKQSREEEPKAA